MHILAGVPSTQTLLDIAQVPLSDPRPSSSSNPLQRRTFSAPKETSSFTAEQLPDESGLDRVAKEARACGEVNYVGTVLALACFVRPASVVPPFGFSVADGPAAGTSLHIQNTSPTPPLLGGSYDPSTVPSNLLGDESSGLHGCRELSGRVRGIWSPFLL